MKTYTVVLLYPDYLTGDFGADLYVSAVEAESIADAVANVQIMAAQDNVPDADDFRPILVLDGIPEIVADATNF